MKTHEFDKLCGSIRESAGIKWRGTETTVIRSSRSLPDSATSPISPRTTTRTLLRAIAILAALHAFAFAADWWKVEKLLARSPDRRFGAIQLGDQSEDRDRVEYFDIVIRDLTNGQPLWIPDEKAFNGSATDSSAVWSPDSSMVILHVSNYHGQEFDLVLRLRNGAFEELAVPEGALPVRWTPDNKLVVTVPVPTVFNFDFGTTSFVEAGPLKSRSR
jgi:hypothetical protein